VQIELLQTKLFNMLSHVRHMRDPQASSDMVPDKVWANLPPDPKIVALVSTDCFTARLTRVGR
jgi:hypothetical protein